MFLLTYGGAIAFALLPWITCAGGGGTVAVNGRTVTYWTDGFTASARCTEICSIVSIGSKEIVIEQDRVLVDGKPKAIIPVKAKWIEVIDAHGTIDIRADHVSVCKCKSAHSLLDLCCSGSECPVSPQYRLEFVTPGRLVRMLTESKSVQKEWKGDPLAKPFPTLKILGKTVIIEQKRLLVNGQPAVVIPPESEQLTFTERSGRVNILADGVFIHQFTR